MTLFFALSHFVNFAIVHAGVLNETGKGFVDEFETLNTKRWKVTNDKLDCSRPCVYFDQDNIQIVPYGEPEDVLSSTLPALKLTLRNDCFGPWCCDTKNSCTKYSGGQVVSKRTYGYGSFRFILQAASVDEGVTAVSSCWELERKKETHMAIGVCINSVQKGDTEHANFIWRYGNNNMHLKHKLKFDAARRPEMYSIEWSSDRIRYYARGELLHEIRDSPDWKIPNRPMRIKASITLYDWPPSRQSREYVTFSMYIRRVRIIQSETITSENGHEELFVIPEEPSSFYHFGFLLVIIIFIFLVESCLIRSVLIRRYKANTVSINSCQYKLMDDI